uniref:MFS transporter n=1 Tax=candidate division WOR-3 bacterium TaxID=2052148 RepID=A0A7C4TIL0_UNCW3
MANQNKNFFWHKTFLALRYPNYRLWFGGQLVSLFGTWMQSTAQGFFIYELTHSPAYLGYVGFAGGLPTWLFMLYGGVVADRVPRRNIMLITQTTMMILAFVLAALTFLKIVQPWHIIILALLMGTANAFDAPARQAFVRELVEPEAMTNAIALNSAMFNTAIAIGPAAGGIIYAALGPAWCFTINGLTFIAVIFALLAMKLNFVHSPKTENSVLKDLKQGFKYTFTHPSIRFLIMTIGVIALFGTTFVTLLPAWSVKILQGDARTNGFLQTARGLGALTSALFIASLGIFHFKGKLLTIGTFLYPIFIILFASTNNFTLAVIFLFLGGMGQILIMNLSNSLVQTQVDEGMRGRVMGIYTFFFFGLMPFGALWIGSVANLLGVRIAIYIASSITFVYAILIYALGRPIWRLK